MTAPDKAASNTETLESAAAKSVVSQVVSTAVGIGVGAAAGPVAGFVAGGLVGLAVDVGGRAMDAASEALGLTSGAPATRDSGLTAIGAAAKQHVVDPVTAKLKDSALVLESSEKALVGAGTTVSTHDATAPSPEAQTAAAAIVKTSENTNIGMAAHKAVKVDPKAPDVFGKIKALLLDKNKTNADKLKEIGEIGGIGDIDDSSFKAFLGIAQAALGMPESKDSDGKTSKDASSFLGNLSENFSKIFTPEAGKSREGGAEEMNSAFAACGEASQIGIGKLSKMQSAFEKNFQSGFKEAIEAASSAKELAESQSQQAGQKPAAPAAKDKLSIKEVGKDSLKIAGSIALSLLVPGGFLIAMAACYILREKDQERGKDEQEADQTAAQSPIKAVVTTASARAPAAGTPVATPPGAGKSAAPTPTPTPPGAGKSAAPTPTPTPVADNAGVGASDAGNVSTPAARAPTTPLLPTSDSPGPIMALDSTPKVNGREFKPVPDAVRAKAVAFSKEPVVPQVPEKPLDIAAMERDAIFLESIALRGMGRAREDAAARAKEAREQVEALKTKAVAPVVTDTDRNNAAFSAMMRRGVGVVTNSAPKPVVPEVVVHKVVSLPKTVPAVVAAPLVAAPTIDFAERIKVAQEADKALQQRVLAAVEARKFIPDRPKDVVTPVIPEQKPAETEKENGSFRDILAAAAAARTADLRGITALRIDSVGDSGHLKPGVAKVQVVPVRYTGSGISV